MNANHIAARDNVITARNRVTLARQRWIEAAQACQRADPQAPALADRALLELNAAMRELRELAEGSI